MPILLYGCEVWGFSNLDVIERVHLKFCKLILHVKNITPNFIVYRELGRYPISLKQELLAIGQELFIVKNQNIQQYYIIYY